MWVYFGYDEISHNNPVPYDITDAEAAEVELHFHAAEITEEQYQRFVRAKAEFEAAVAEMYQAERNGDPPGYHPYC